MVTREAAIAELLDCGSADWVSLQEVVWYSTLGEISPRSKALVADVLRHLFEMGLMIPGDLGHSGFEDWEPPISDWLDRGLSELDRLNWAPMGDGFWLRLAHRGEPAIRDWTKEQLARMSTGRAPQRFNPDKGGIESMDLSHEPVPFRDGGTTVVPRWPQEHAAVNPFRRPGY